VSPKSAALHEMKHLPRISIITVCYNVANTIGDTLRSVREQTYPNVEHIIVDGGSSDNTLEVVSAEGEHVFKVVSERDDGIYDAMNKGLGLANGDIVGFINADDFYSSADVLAMVASAFESSGVDCCYGDLCYVRQDDVVKMVRYWRSAPFAPGMFGRGWCPPHPTFFVRREVYARLGGFDLNFKIGADIELMARFLEVGRISSHYIPKILVHMRMGGTTNRSLSNIVKQNLEIRRGFMALGLGFSWWRFMGNKVVSRALQFVRRPAL
jgi:glycosyltransferase involved in cell wall biosynthesis